jgi:hypothetical protein
MRPPNTYDRPIECILAHRSHAATHRYALTSLTLCLSPYHTSVGRHTPLRAFSGTRDIISQWHIALIRTLIHMRGSSTLPSSAKLRICLQSFIRSAAWVMGSGFKYQSLGRFPT